MTHPLASAEIGQIALIVRDVPTSKRFYADVIGLKPLFDAGPALSFLSAGSVRIMLTAQGGEPGRNSILYFKTPHAETAYAEAVRQGATPEQSPRLTAKLPDHELWLAFIRDPDGNLLGFMEERR